MYPLKSLIFSSRLSGLTLHLPRLKTLAKIEWLPLSQNIRLSSNCCEKSGSLPTCNVNYLEYTYRRWKRDKSAVHPSWNEFFSSIEFTNNVSSSESDPSFTPRTIGELSINFLPSVIPCDVDLKSNQNDIKSQSVYDTVRLIQMIRFYQMRGHEFANTEPLGLPRIPPFVSISKRNNTSKLDYKYFGFTDADMDRFFNCRMPKISGFLGDDCAPKTLRNIIQRLEETYCGTIGYEYMHIVDNNICNFIRHKIETPEHFKFSSEIRTKILIKTARAQLFENYFASKFPTLKRFGLDGCETLIVAMKAITKYAAKDNIDSVIIGMSHRGRLNVLVNVMHKPMQQMMSEFQGVTGFGNSDWGNTGDVKYHLGVEFDHFDVESQRNIHLGVLANPSHLEAVAPLVLGRTRARQYYSKDTERSKVLSLMLHGDASFAGQGVVYESLQLSKVPSYTVGGTIHIVVNNQIGFTTNPVDAGSGGNPTDLAKCINAPVFHVNGDDPEAVHFVAELAFEYRKKFKSDVIIDLVGYRRYGHNELDMPKFTQPHMYNLIAKHKTVLELFSQRLLQENVITTQKIDEIKKDIADFYVAEYEKSKKFMPPHSEYLSQWKHMANPNTICSPRITGVSLDSLRDLGRKVSTLPSSFNAHPTISKTFKARLDAIEKGDDIDFGLAEALAFASLLSDGFHIRLSGQDSQRGTFSHRHSVVHDQVTYDSYNIFDSLKYPHIIEINNSTLSEYAAFGYEVGYALENPDALCIWEAQFGDFANGAQVVIDQFIASGEVKWNRQCGIVMILPHGFDGQGPEHSSARIERFLQLCDDREDAIDPLCLDLERTSAIQKHNMQVVYCSTPVNYFHVLRRQLHRGFRKPLIIFLSKKLLKLRATFCKIEDFGEGTRFARYIPDALSTDSESCDKIDRLILCSGQVYYDLTNQRSKLKSKNVAISRVEQLSPFPYDLFMEDIKRYKNLSSLVWAQEEHSNAGAWTYLSRRIETALRIMNYPNGIRTSTYVGRGPNAAPAVGDSRTHQLELQAFLQIAFA